MARLTDRLVASLKATLARRDVFDSVVSGLAVRVNLGGAKTWTVFYREHVPDDAGGFVAGRRLRRWTLGEYPAVSLAAARTRTRKALDHLVRRGIDPGTQKRHGRTGTTFADLAKDYIDRYAKPHKRSWEQDQTTITTELLPDWRHRPAKAVTRQHVRDLLDVIIDRGAPVRANRVWSLISRIFNHGVERDLVEANPASRIRKQPEVSRDRELSEAELRELWTALEGCQAPVSTSGAGPAVSKMIALGMQVLLLTAQRPGEVYQMRREDVDLTDGWWTIPAHVAKNKQVHRVPLTPLAVTLIDQAIAQGPTDGRWVFSGVPIGNVSSRAKKAASALTTAGAVGFAFHRHDLRRTAASGMARAGVSRETIAKVLNHVDRGARATAVYDRYSYDKEKRTALETWDRTLTAILEQEDASKVLPFQRGA